MLVNPGLTLVLAGRKLWQKRQRSNDMQEYISPNQKSKDGVTAQTAAIGWPSRMPRPANSVGNVAVGPVRVTPEAAQRRRYELLEQDRAGEYKPKQERKADQLTFGELMEKHYLPWAGENKKHAHDDRSRYLHWLKPRFADKLLRDIAPLDLERVKKEMREAGKSEATAKACSLLGSTGIQQGKRVGTMAR